MLSKELQNALNEQIQHEFSAAHTYLAMSAHFEEKNLPGFAKWMRLQSEEERAHGMRLFDFMLDRGGHLELHGVEKPPQDYSSPLDVMERALEHEKKVTSIINDLYALAVKENDYATQVQLQWFIQEQVEEEKTVGDLVERLRMAGTEPAAILILDREVGERTTAE